MLVFHRQPWQKKSDYIIAEAKPGEEFYYRLEFGFTLKEAVPYQQVSNHITITVGDYVFTDTITTFGTLHNIKIV